MKTTQLVIGLVQVAGCVALMVTPYGTVLPEGSLRVVAFFGVLAGCAVLSFRAANNVLDALFGSGGLVLDVSRMADRDNVRDERKLAPRKRLIRVTHPSATLQQRGAKRRLRNLGGTFARR